ncbi:g6096 [Coccomyxa viridis]|uniref:G6096 protein n=1 Tax=Coccomyxa viridis TaxID=1274662 RepID=A0ABP1G186_9CHLO
MGDSVREQSTPDDSDTLVLIPAAELHLVQSGSHQLVEKGPLSLSIPGRQSDSTVLAKVGATSWPLEKTSPTLKSGEYAYVFAIEGGTAFYSALLSTGTPEADQALFEEILVECTAFQLAGALTEESVKEAVNEVAELVLSRAPGTAGSSAPAGPVSGSESAPSSQATQAAVSEAVTSTEGQQPAAFAKGVATSTAAATPSGDPSQQYPSISPEQEEPDATESHSHRILTGTARVTEAIGVSAAWATQKIAEQSARWKQQIKPAKQINVPPEIKKRLLQGSHMAKRTAKTSGWVAQKAGDISIRVAESIVRRVGPKQGFGAQLQEGGQRRRDAAQEIAAASLVAAVEIYSSMEAAAQLVLESGSTAASDIAGHKYGPDAAEVTSHAAEMATQSATAAMRLRTGGVKTIAQRVARHTALGFARQAVYGPGKQGQPPKKPAARQQVQQRSATPAAAAAPGPLSPFAMAPASILPPESPSAAPGTAQPSLSPFALAQGAPEESPRPSPATDATAAAAK